jgi:Domain of unknown function(DUF2779)
MIAPDDCLTIARPRRFPYISLAAIDTHQASIKPESPFSLQERWRSYAHLVVHDNVEIPPESCAQYRSTSNSFATDASDPRRKFVSSLCGALGESGSIVVYSQQFESTKLSALAGWLPEFAGRIKNIQRRLFDLLPVVRNYAYHPEFRGSYSFEISAALAGSRNDLEGMVVANGQDAGIAWESLGYTLKVARANR